MSWPYIWVRLRHKPSGLTAEANCLRSHTACAASASP